MRAHASLALLLSVLSLAAVACHASSDDGSEVGADRLTTTAKKGGEFVRCSATSDGTADEFFRVYTVSCRASSAGLGTLTGSRINIDAKSTGGTVQSKPLDDSLDQDVVIGAVHKSDFPLDVHLYGFWSPNGFVTMSEFSTHVPLAETATADAPVVVNMPFDTWPLKFINHVKVAQVSAEAYTVEAAPFITFTDPNGVAHTTFQNSGSYTDAVSDATFSLDLPAPKEGSLLLTAQGSAAGARLQIDAPGTYVIDTQGIHLASADEEAATPATPTAPVDAGTDAAPSADAGPTVPTTCGNAQQAPCTSGSTRSCNPDTRYDSFQSECVACGAAGQTYCLTGAGGMSGAQKCDDGTRYDSFQSQCIACGAAGQTYCLTDPTNATGAQKCNDGTRYDSFQSQCITCGAAGQTYCLSDPTNAKGSQKCNPGLTYNSFTSQCQ